MGLLRWHVRMGLHPLRDLRGRGRLRGEKQQQGGRACEELLRHDALHRHRRVVNLPPRVLLRVLDGTSQRRRAQPGLQSRRLREQDRVLPCHLAVRQEGHRPQHRMSLCLQVCVSSVRICHFVTSAREAKFSAGFAGTLVVVECQQTALGGFFRKVKKKKKKKKKSPWVCTTG